MSWSWVPALQGMQALAAEPAHAPATQAAQALPSALAVPARQAMHADRCVFGERPAAQGLHLVPSDEYLRYSSRKAKSGHGPARVVWVLAWPHHTNCTVATAPLDPCTRGTSGKREYAKDVQRGVAGVAALLILALLRAGLRQDRHTMRGVKEAR